LEQRRVVEMMLRVYEIDLASMVFGALNFISELLGKIWKPIVRVMKGLEFMKREISLLWLVPVLVFAGAVLLELSFRTRFPELFEPEDITNNASVTELLKRAGMQDKSREVQLRWAIEFCQPEVMVILLQMAEAEGTAVNYEAVIKWVEQADRVDEYYVVVMLDAIQDWHRNLDGREGQ